MNSGKAVGVADALPGKWRLGIRDGKTIACMVIETMQSLLILRVEDDSADIVSDHEFISLYEPERCEIIPDAKSIHYTVKPEKDTVKPVNGALCVAQNGTFIKVDRISTDSPLYVDIRTGSLGEPIDDFFSFSKWSLVSRCGNEKRALLNFRAKKEDAPVSESNAGTYPAIQHAAKVPPRLGLTSARFKAQASYTKGCDA